ncbi:MAG: sugar ABC transporter permease [Caldilineaceae bacterium]|jgi:raffinose/stachyose/melibiose transport system permease protein|nr:sugar ABC transporter permease [Caldilineaceae bacterium]
MTNSVQTYDNQSEKPRKRRRASARQRSEWRDGYMLVAPALILFVLLVVYPMFNTIYLSFFNYGLTDARIRFIGANNFIELMGDEVFWRALRNNLTILIVSVIVQVGVGLILAALIDRGIRWGKSIARTLNFVPVVMSAVAVAILWQLIYDPTVGLANRFVSLIGLDPPSQGWLGDPRIVIYSILVVACWQYTGYVMIIILAGMQSVSQELYEAAAIDGATEIQKFFSITLPSIRNVNIAVILITMIGAVKVFDLVYILTRGGPANASQVMGTYIYYNAFTVNRAGYASAISVVLLVFALILGFLQLRLSVRPREAA